MYFEWERLIPFVPLMIVPYMSIDLFFVAAPFLCRDERELKVFGKRIVLGIVVASLCFLLFPLKFSFHRPVTGGWLGHVFDWFRTMDQPFNQLPSLHLTLRTILLVTLISVIGSLLAFDQFYIMTAGQPQNLTATSVFFIYLNSFPYLKLGYGAALSLILAVFVLLFTLVQMLATRRSHA